MRVTVIVCTHNPRPDHLAQALAALRGQSLPLPDWELLVVDNASQEEIAPDIAWHPHAQLLREPRLGLTFARTRGIAQARGEILVFCDDDNLLDPDFLAEAVALFQQDRNLGAAGGRSLGRYEKPPPVWFGPFAHLLALRDFGNEKRVDSWRGGRPNRYPFFAPIGAGLVVHREVALDFVARLEPRFTDRSGEDLSSGGDCALVLAALRRGWSVGYYPQLILDHLIPPSRLQLGYLARLNRASTRSWVRLLAAHGICPWTPVSRWSVPLRKARAFFAQRPWRGPSTYLRFAGACGQFEGLAHPDQNAP